MNDITWMVDNLNRNVMRDHIYDCEHGLAEKDEDYIEFKKIEKHLQSLEDYQKYKNSLIKK